jgi:hypothetical protein
MLGQHELDINDTKETHVLRALRGRIFSARELVCIMYAGFKRIKPEMDMSRKWISGWIWVKSGGWRRDKEENVEIAA